MIRYDNKNPGFTILCITNKAIDLLNAYTSVGNGVIRSYNLSTTTAKNADKKKVIHYCNKTRT
jgi:hypothetical protein